MGIAARFDGQIVAAVLPVAANRLRHPPDRRVIEEKPLGEPLQHIDQVVETADVREFMEENGFGLRGGSPANNPTGIRIMGRRCPRTMGTSTIDNCKIQ